MCGLAGYLVREPRATPADSLEPLLSAIRARGPDDEGVCLISRRDGAVRSLHTAGSAPRPRDELPSLRDRSSWIDHDLAIVHTRYAVIDRTGAAHQPFVTPNGEVVVAFQGEIFNYLEIRQELIAKGFRLRTSSDTEVLAMAYAAWGDESWARLNGFWAAAVFDTRRRRFVLSRDRLGIAPLHLRETEECVLFSTSARGLASAGRSGPQPRLERVAAFIETGLRDFDAFTLFQDVRSLPPGTFLAFDAGETRDGRAIEHRYWDLPRTRLSAADLSLREASARLRSTLESAVEYRLRADRPIAFQLSAGLDSTAVVALASALREGPLTTYTVSTPENDEEPRARTMARRFNLDFNVLENVGSALARDALAFARLMEEPVQAPSAYANHVMCRRMKADGFGVVVSGSGGDEVLAGYEWDFWPAAQRLLASEGRRWEAASHHLLTRYGTPGRAAASLAAWMRWVARLPGRVVGRVSPTPKAGVSGPQAPHDDAGGAASRVLADYARMDYDARRRFHFRVAHLPYYLASNDRATLGIPIEHRQPFLDHRVVEQGLAMPPDYLFRRGWTKYVLRDAMAHILPPEVVWRREKLGFPSSTAALLRAHRPVLEAAAQRAAALGTVPAGIAPFDELLRRDPLRLWRVSAVGLWLEAVL